MTVNLESRYAMASTDRIGSTRSSDRALLNCQSVVADCAARRRPSVMKTSSATRYWPCWGGLLAKVLFSPDLKPEEEWVRLRKIQRLGSKTTR
jgi:hypothetical protein